MSDVKEPAISSNDLAEVAATTQERWRVAGEASRVIDWAEIASALEVDPGETIRSTVVLPRSGQMECILDDRSDIREARDQVRSLLLHGWTVNALLPLRSLGAAHEAFRGMRVHLQGWWVQDDGRMRFTSQERP